MYNKMSIDFGTSNTVVAFWDEEKKDVVIHHIPDVSRSFRFIQDGIEMEMPCIPSLIYYHDQNTRFVGHQVIEKSLERSQGTFKWMKAYIQSRRSIKYPLPDGTHIDYFQAAKDFLEIIILFAKDKYIDIASCEVAFTVPVEAFEHYTDWLSDACLKIGLTRYRFIDESSACIFGYDTHLQAGDKFFIFDFGGGTLDCSVVRIEDSVEGGKGCSILGKAGCNIGGRIIDGWLYSEILKRADINDLDARDASGLFMLEVEKIKEQLSNALSYKYDIRHEGTGIRLKGVFERTELEDLMEKNNLYHDVQQTIDRALNDANQKGVTKNDIKDALLVGGTGQIPSIRRQVTNLFGARTRQYRPYDAVARGACKYLTEGIEALYDHIQHNYSIKSYDSKTGSHKFIPLIPKGTSYPTSPEFKRLTLKGVRDGQRFFGIDIFEIAESGTIRSGAGEVIFDLNGGVVFERNTSAVDAGTEFWMNENNPTFIEADPPGEKGTPHFSVVFRVDSQKRLLVTVWDIKTQRRIYNDYPVVKLK